MNQGPGVPQRTGQVLGWVSGLALLVAPWIGAGVLATFGTMVGPESWTAERTFPWWLLAAVVASFGWLVYGSIRIPGFLRGALPGAAIALAVMVVIYLLALIAQG